MQKAQRAPQQLFFYNNKLQLKDLTSNQVVGSSNLSGRAILVVFVEVLRESCGIAKHLVSETIVDKSLLRKIPAGQ